MDVLGNCRFAELAGRSLSEFFQHASEFCLALAHLSLCLLLCLENKNVKAISLENRAKVPIPGQKK